MFSGHISVFIQRKAFPVKVLHRTVHVLGYAPQIMAFVSVRLKCDIFYVILIELELRNSFIGMFGLSLATRTQGQYLKFLQLIPNKSSPYIER
jgi:hypothetical protein